VGNSLKRPIEKTAIYLLNPAVSRVSTKALSDQLKAPVLTVLPEWLLIGYNNPETTEDESGMKYNQEADVLVILGADTKE
jgi:thiamine pyrophosphate-dependent acetolactate synthase large subunit-like protein